MTIEANTSTDRRRGLSADQILMLWVCALALAGLAAMVAVAG